MSETATVNVGRDGSVCGPEVLESFLEKAARRGEEQLSIARLVLTAIAFARHLALYSDRILAGRPRAVCDAIVMLGLGLLGTLVLLLLKSGASTRKINYLSACVDAVAVFALEATAIFFPPEGYNGVLRLAHWPLVYLAIASGALRLSTSAALLALVANTISFFGLLALDRVLRPGMLDYGFGIALLSAIMLLAFAILSVILVRRTRSLVFAGAMASLQAERARQRLGAYVSEEVARTVLGTGEFRLGGHRQTVAVLFSDLRDFTRYSEKVPPERLVIELNGYLTAMVSAIRAHGGVVDKYIGDSIMAVFGIPAERPDDALRAIETAQAMRAALAAHNQERARRGLAPLRQGIGIHYGPVIAGNIGTSERMQYTVVGSTVNVASRLEAATKELHAELLVSAEARAAASKAGGVGLELVSQGRIDVRGLEEEIEVFSLPGAGKGHAAA